MAGVEDIRLLGGVDGMEGDWGRNWVKPGGAMLCSLAGDFLSGVTSRPGLLASSPFTDPGLGLALTNDPSNLLLRLPLPSLSSSPVSSSE